MKLHFTWIDTGSRNCYGVGVFYTSVKSKNVANTYSITVLKCYDVMTYNVLQAYRISCLPAFGTTISKCIKDIFKETNFRFFGIFSFSCLDFEQFYEHGTNQFIIKKIRLLKISSFYFSFYRYHCIKLQKKIVRAHRNINVYLDKK